MRLLVLAFLIVLLLPSVALADGGGLPITVPASQAEHPPGFATSARDAIAAADRTQAVRDARRAHPGLEATAYIWALKRWEVDYQDAKGIVVDVDVSSSGRVLAVWTGPQAQSYFMRDFGLRFGSPWIWIVCILLFAVPFVDRRRPLRALHLDCLVLAGFGVPFALLSARHVTGATWVLAGLLAYLLVRALRIGSGRSRLAVPEVRLPTVVLVVGLLAMVGGRIAVNVTEPSVVDVGAMSVVGADRIMHGDPLYVDNDSHGDTYGPLNYVAYIPFALALPSRADGNALPAAHAAAIAFDLLTLLGLFVLGCRLRPGPRGRRLGLVLAWAWAAYPLGLYSLMRSTNDGLVAAGVVWALVGCRRPAVRGALLGAAAAAKFFPAALVGALWRGTEGFSTRRALGSLAACLGVFALAVAVYLPAGGVREFWDCTLGFQLSRPADFSLWGLYGLKGLQVAVEAGGVALAIAVGFWPRGPRTVPQLAALAAAVTLAVQLAGGHWWFFYVDWFVPLLLVALLAPSAAAPVAPADAPAVPERELVPA